MSHAVSLAGTGSSRTTPPHARGQQRIVRGGDQGLAAGQLHQRIDHASRGLGVEMRGRLVDQQQVGLRMHHHARQRQAHRFAARQARCRPRPAPAAGSACATSASAAKRIASRTALQSTPARPSATLLCTEPREDMRPLADPADARRAAPAAEASVSGTPPMAISPHCAGTRPAISEKQHRLARAARAHQRDMLAGADPQA